MKNVTQHTGVLEVIERLPSSANIHKPKDEAQS